MGLGDSVLDILRGSEQSWFWEVSGRFGGDSGRFCLVERCGGVLRVLDVELVEVVL